MKTTKPTFGWTVISRDELRSVDQWLTDDEQGVRDELGFLIIHQRFADLFFPGTSTQQRRLRYALFVPWIYNEADRQPPKVDRRDFIAQRFLRLTGKLKQSDEAGIIGGKVYPRSPSIPQDTIYWSALRAWKILQPLADGSQPSSAEAVRYLETTKHRHTRISEELDASLEHRRLFYELPEPNPIKHLDREAPIDFRLTDVEKSWLGQKLCDVTKANSHAAPTLLARLVKKRVQADRAEFPWDAQVCNVADEEDQRALAAAKHVAALAAVGRGIYGLLVEGERRHDGLAKSQFPADALNRAVSQYGNLAAQTDLTDLKRWIGAIPADLENILQVTLQWLKDGNANRVNTLVAHYAKAELNRKGPQRARLANNSDARERRKQWNPETEPEPLHYRWSLVKVFLADLLK